MIGNHRIYARRGSRCKQSKLTEDDVQKIRALLRYRDSLLAEARTLRAADIAEKFGVSKKTIDKIAEYGSWVHVL